jgi:hypothetical protein
VDANGAQDRSQPYQTQAQGMLFVSRKYKSTTLLISLPLFLSGSLGVFIRYVEGFFASNFLIFILWWEVEKEFGIELVGELVV